MAVLATLRTLICMGVAVLVWYVLVLTINAPDNVAGVLLPVWLGGIAGGVVSSIFSRYQGIAMAFASGVLLCVIFLWFRHFVADLPLGGNTMLTLWPVWFPPAFYVGSYGYLLAVARKG